MLWIIHIYDPLNALSDRCTCTKLCLKFIRDIGDYFHSAETEMNIFGLSVTVDQKKKLLYSIIIFNETKIM